MRVLESNLPDMFLNVIFDYALMFSLGMGMCGAALATALSPPVGASICLIHILSKRSRVKLKRIRPSAEKLIYGR